MKQKFFNKLGCLALGLSLAAVPFLASAQNASVEGVLSQIRQAQSVSQNRDIVCAKVTDDQFQELGDAVVSVMHPNENEHNLMDQMMGGEGSNSLKAMEIYMGRRYLGCAGTVSGGMMGFGNGWSNGMMGGNGWNDWNGNWGIMGNYGYRNNFSWVLMVLFWVFVVAGIILLVRCLTGRCGMKGKNKSALDILNERYAKGEINKTEYEEKKKDLL